MRLKMGYTVSASDLFKNFDISKIKTHHSILKEHYKTREKKEMAVRVFLYAIYLIILDIIENNVIFVFPNRFGRIQMGSIGQEQFKKARQLGKFKNIDYVVSNFTTCRLQFIFKGTNKKIVEKWLYVNSALRDKIEENINNGKKYV